MIKTRLHIIMAVRRMNIQQVADLSGLSRTTVSALYNGKAQGIQFDTLSALCCVLECEVGELIYYTEG